MKMKSRYLSLLFIFVFLFLPGETSGMSSGYGNFTEEQDWNGTENSSEFYFNFSSSSGCINAGEMSDDVKEVSANELIQNVTFLTNTTESELSPIWTIDGNHIIYTIQRKESGNSELYKMEINGSKVERIGIENGSSITLGDINPNGTEIITTKSTDSQVGLYLISLENRTVVPVTDDLDKSECWGSWCRLGKKIVYTQKLESTPSQLWIIDKNGTGNMRLGTSENVGMGKDWCPLGLKIVYSARNSKEKDDLWVIDRHGINQIQLTNTTYGEWNPTFSPDGKKIVYVSDEGGNPEIWLRDIEGNYRVKLTNKVGIVDSAPKWSPDGSKMAFVARSSQNSNTHEVYGLENSATNFENDSEIKNSGATSSDIMIIKFKPEFSSSLPELTGI